MKLIFLYFLMVCMLLSGTVNKVLSKMQNSTKGNNQKFYHPFFQTFLLFFGESLLLPMYFLYEFRKRRTNKKDDFDTGMQIASMVGLKSDVNVLIFLVPTLIDIVSSTAGFIALNFIEASVFLMFNGLGFLFIIIFSVLFLKFRPAKRQYIGIPLIIGGLTLVGYASLTDKKGREDSDNKWIGFVFVMITQLFGALFYVSEEILFKKYYLNPLKVAGWEGVWGTIIYAIILTVLQFINCSGKLCPQGRLDNTKETFSQLGDNYWLIIFTVAMILTHAMYNGFGISITKYASSAQRSTMNSCKTAIVWVFFLVFQGPGHENFLWMQLVGFA
jgi:drug/metabolite transporter (DMT)-like permease